MNESKIALLTLHRCYKVGMLASNGDKPLKLIRTVCSIDIGHNVLEEKIFTASWLSCMQAMHAAVRLADVGTVSAVRKSALRVKTAELGTAAVLALYESKKL